VKRKGFVSLFACCLMIESILGADFWQKKAYTQWSQEECKMLLMKSPWSFIYTETNIYEPATNISSGTSGPPTQGQSSASLEPQTGERETSIHFLFTLLSAKPIRMARGQLALLKAPETKGQVEQMINQPESKVIVVQLSYASEPPGISAMHDIHAFFLRASLADFQTNTHLMSSEGKIVPIAAYAQPNEKNPFALLIFPRFDSSGAPNFTGKEKSITMRCECKIPIAAKGRDVPFRMSAKMDPKKMVFDNQFCL
jgi:hypothetical protein